MLNSISFFLHTYFSSFAQLDTFIVWQFIPNAVLQYFIESLTHLTFYSCVRSILPEFHYYLFIIIKLLFLYIFISIYRILQDMEIKHLQLNWAKSQRYSTQLSECHCSFYIYQILVIYHLLPTFTYT